MILSMLALLAAQAPDRWVRTGQGDGFTDYVDVDSISTEGNRRTVWQRRVMDAPDENGVASVLARLRYDCNARTFSMLSLSERRCDGSVIQTIEATPAEQSPNDVPPNSVGEAAMNLACR